jgi:glycosyltransferase involved in cell wall biosynthesis
MAAVSIIVPVYNVEKYLDECVQSILAQTFNDFELILVDDRSPDGCPALCDGYAQKDSRVKVIHNGQNRGLPTSRKIGLDAAISGGGVSIFNLSTAMTGLRKT